MLLWSRGNTYLPASLLEGSPFQTFLIPGLLLGVFVGGSSVLCAVATARGFYWRADAALFAGGALTAWIAGEVAVLRVFSWLQVFYGGLGVALLVMGSATVRQAATLRHRWVIGVTLAEALGYLAPIVAGTLSVRWSADHRPIGWMLVVAGCVEGACLGYGQSSILPWKVSKWRYVVATSLAAGGVWAGVFGLMSHLAAPGLWGAARWLIAGAGGLMLFAIGCAQWFELRRVVRNARPWIWWTALAWLAALPLSFLPGPLVDERTPLIAQFVLWGVGGVLMAYVMAWLTWFGVQALQRPS